MIKINNLRKVYTTDEVETTAINNIISRSVESLEGKP